MLERIFEKIDVFSQNLTNIETQLAAFYTLKKQVEDNYSAISKKYDTHIQSNLNKVKTLEVFLSQNSSEKLLVSDDFANTENLLSNSDFEFLADKTAFKLKPVKVEQNNDFTVYSNSVSGNKSFIVFSFKKEIDLNALEYSFTSLKYGIVLPTSIKYLRSSTEYDLIENFERYFDSKLSSVKKHYFYPKNVKAVKFYFDVPINEVKVDNINFYTETYPAIASLDFKYPVKSSSDYLSLFFNFEDMLSGLNFSVMENNSFVDLNVKNKKCILKNQNTDFIYLKANFDSSKIANKNNSVVSSEYGKRLLVTPDDDVLALVESNQKINIENDFKITLNYSLYKAIKDLNIQDSFVDFVNDEVVLKEDKIKIFKSESAENKDVLIQRLNDLSEVEHLEFYTKEIFALDLTTGILYFPYFANNYDFKFSVIYTVQEYEEITNTNYYSPFIFDLKISS